MYQNNWLKFVAYELTLTQQINQFKFSLYLGSGKKQLVIIRAHVCHYIAWLRAIMTIPDHSPFQSNRFYLLQLFCCSKLISNNSCQKNWSCMSFCLKLYAVASSITFKSRGDKINTISAKFDLNSFVSNWYSRALAWKFNIEKPETETETRNHCGLTMLNAWFMRT